MQIAPSEHADAASSSGASGETHKRARHMLPKAERTQQKQQALELEVQATKELQAQIQTLKT
jgi:hypothetical protein